MDGAGDVFQKETKYRRGELTGRSRDSGDEPKAFKTFPEAGRISLPEPARQGGPPLWDIIQKRQSCRRFKRAAMPLADLSQLLWATQGVTRVAGGFAFRAAPSAGALYPVETYLAVHNVESLGRGIYHYGVLNHALDLLRPGDVREAVASAALDQGFTAEAAVVLIWTAVFGRTKRKYGQRGYRYVYLDAGHIGQAAAAAAVGLGFGSCQIAALYDDESSALVGADGTGESVIYMTAVGVPA
jgi:SagB-type dehydrogenase family enzyme